MSDDFRLHAGGKEEKPLEDVTKWECGRHYVLMAEVIPGHFECPEPGCDRSVTTTVLPSPSA